VVAGTLLTFIPACGAYINAELLGTPQQFMVGNRIQQAFLTEHNYPLAASLSLILMAVVVAMVVVYVRRAGTEDLL
jgi:spermidine/putrescine transport system permease protein